MALKFVGMIACPSCGANAKQFIDGAETFIKHGELFKTLQVGGDGKPIPDVLVFAAHESRMPWRPGVRMLRWDSCPTCGQRGPRFENPDGDPDLETHVCAKCGESRV